MSCIFSNLVMEFPHHPTILTKSQRHTFQGFYGSTLFLGISFCTSHFFLHKKYHKNLVVFSNRSFSWPHISWFLGSSASRLAWMALPYMSHSGSQNGKAVGIQRMLFLGLCQKNKKANCAKAQSKTRVLYPYHVRGQSKSHCKVQIQGMRNYIPPTSKPRPKWYRILLQRSQYLGPIIQPFVRRVGEEEFKKKEERGRG